MTDTLPPIAEIDAELGRLGWTGLVVRLIDDGVIVWATREDAPSLRITARGHDSREGRLRLLRQAREMAS